MVSVYRIIVVSFSANITHQLSVTFHCGSFRSLAADMRCSLHCIPSVTFHCGSFRSLAADMRCSLHCIPSVTFHCGSFRSLAADMRCSLHCIPSAASISISARCTCSIQAFLLPPLDTLHCGPPALFDPSISPPTVGHAPLRSSGVIGSTHSPPTVGHALRSFGVIGSTHSPPNVGHAPLRSSFVVESTLSSLRGRSERHA